MICRASHNNKALIDINRQAVHIERGYRSHRVDVNEMVAQIVNIENETEPPKK